MSGGSVPNHKAGVAVTQIRDPFPAGPTSDADLAALERHVGYPLPAEYRRFLLEHNGGRPEPDAFPIDTGLGEQEDIVMCLFPARPPDLGAVEVNDFQGLRRWPVHCAFDDLWSDLENLYAEAGITDPLLPVGTDGSGNYFCLVLDGPRSGAVVFLDHETGETFPLGDSFGAFLGSLRPRERTDYAF